MKQHLIIVALMALFICVSVSQASLERFTGIWNNSDSETGGLTRLEITVDDRDESSLHVRAFGRARPRDSDLGVTEATPYGNNVGADLVNAAKALTASFHHDFADRLLIIRPGHREHILTVDEFVNFTDRSERSNYQSTHSFTRALTARPRPTPTRPMRPIRQPREEDSSIEEDCIEFDWESVRVRRIDGSWKLVDGDHWIRDFGNNRGDANRALRIIRHYRLNSICFVGRPDPSMTYLLSDGEAPSGPMPGEDALAFDPARLQVREIDGSFKIVEGDRWLMDFGSSRDEADTALSIIRRYGFTHRCFVGRPNPSFVYFRR